MGDAAELHATVRRQVVLLERSVCALEECGVDLLLDHGGSRHVHLDPPEGLQRTDGTAGCDWAHRIVLVHKEV